MAQEVKTFATKAEDLSMISRSHGLHIDSPHDKFLSLFWIIPAIIQYSSLCAISKEIPSTSIVTC